VLNPRLFVKFVTLVVLLGYLVHPYILRDCYDRRHNNTKDKYSYHKYPLLLHDILLSVVIISNFADGIFKQALQKSLSYQQNRKTDCNSNHCQSDAFLCRHFFSPYSGSEGRKFFVVSRLRFLLYYMVSHNNDYPYNVHHPHNNFYVHHFSPLGSISPICILLTKSDNSA